MPQSALDATVQPARPASIADQPAVQHPSISSTTQAIGHASAELQPHSPATGQDVAQGAPPSGSGVQGSTTDERTILQQAQALAAQEHSAPLASERQAGLSAADTATDELAQSMAARAQEHERNEAHPQVVEAAADAAIAGGQGTADSAQSSLAVHATPASDIQFALQPEAKIEAERTAVHHQHPNGSDLSSSATSEPVGSMFQQAQQLAEQTNSFAAVTDAAEQSRTAVHHQHPDESDMSSSATSEQAGSMFQQAQQLAEQSNTFAAVTNAASVPDESMVDAAADMSVDLHCAQAQAAQLSLFDRILQQQEQRHSATQSAVERDALAESHSADSLQSSTAESSQAHVDTLVSDQLVASQSETSVAQQPRHEGQVSDAGQPSTSASSAQPVARVGKASALLQRAQRDLKREIFQAQVRQGNPSLHLQPYQSPEDALRPPAYLPSETDQRVRRVQAAVAGNVNAFRPRLSPELHGDVLPNAPGAVHDLGMTRRRPHVQRPTDVWSQRSPHDHRASLGQQRAPAVQAGAASGPSMFAAAAQAAESAPSLTARLPDASSADALVAALQRNESERSRRQAFGQRHAPSRGQTSVWGSGRPAGVPTNAHARAQNAPQQGAPRAGGGFHRPPQQLRPSGPPRLRSDELASRPQQRQQQLQQAGQRMQQRGAMAQQRMRQPAGAAEPAPSAPAQQESLSAFDIMKMMAGHSSGAKAKPRSCVSLLATCRERDLAFGEMQQHSLPSDGLCSCHLSQWHTH